MIKRSSIKRTVVSVTATMALGMIAGAAPAMAAPSAWWSLTSGSWPTNLPENGSGKIVVTMENMGVASIEGATEPVVIEDIVPEHATVTAAEGVAGESPADEHNRGPVPCSSPSARIARCVFEKTLPPYEEIEVRIAVKTTSAATGEDNTVTVSGGGARVATLTKPISVGAANAFGVADYELNPEEEGGATSSQAGVHPFQLTTVLGLDTSEATPVIMEQEPAAMAKDLTFQLPAGLVGNPTPFAQCTDAQFSTQEPKTEHNECEAKSAIGVATVTFNTVRNAPVGFSTRAVPVFNLVPLAGEPARFGFEVLGNRTFIDIGVRSGSDYGVTATVSNIVQTIGFMGSKVTLWGIPGSPVHDGRRGWNCLEERQALCSAEVVKPPPFLSMPTSCEGPLRTTVQADSWEDPHPSAAQLGERPLFAEDVLEQLAGCNQLQFNPEIKVAPDVPDASAATGLGVTVHVPQTAALDPEGVAESALRNTTVVLPEGVAVNPGGADGLETCSTSQVGYLGSQAGEPDTRLFTPLVESPFCPDGSKIGTVELEIPLLPNMLKGAVYLAAQNQNPFGSLLALYMVAKDPVSGVVLKLAGEVSLNPTNGQVVTTFKNTPDVPFENLRLHFYGESRAPLSTPAQCGPHTTQAMFAPWSGNAPSRVSSTFNIASGPDGTPCPGASLPFGPSLTAGTTSIQAGGFSPFTMTMSRPDGQQSLQSVSLKLPPGLSGLLTGVELCGEAQANAGSCGPGSLIGQTTVSVGVGGSPFTVTGGKVYLTGPYRGAPFGLSIVNPAKAGPFDVEHDTSKPSQYMPACDCLVVRAKIEVDPITAELTVSSDNEGPYKIPTIIDGIPLQIQHVNVTVNRPGFTFNPTDCEPLHITGSLQSAEGASDALAVPFQATNCATLGFKPAFNVSTSGRTSRAKGASLHVKLVYPKAPFGSQANIRYVKVDLPRQLPSRLPTLQKACPHQTFEANPAACPVASRVGFAKATTPLLPVQLEGPAYFVSYGGAKFPELVIVLQGYGVTLDLHGETFISEKTNVTSSTFKTVPDAPVGSFELDLPQGQYSALAANTNLCSVAGGLKMPTRFVAQNGAEVKQSTPIAVSGCAPAIRVLGKRVKNGTATLTVGVPSAGRLRASGAGLTGASKRLPNAGTTTISVSLSAGERNFLARHRGRRLKAHVKLVFTPSHGKTLRTTVSVLVG